MKDESLGVDIGNVIIDHRSIVDANDQIWRQENYSKIPPADNVFSCLKKISDEKFNENIFLFSKVKEGNEKRTLDWLLINDFYNKTGIKPKNIMFCRERNEKEEICTNNNIKYFIDDRLEVLSHMIGKIPHLYLFQPDLDKVNEFKQFLPDVTVVQNWEEVTKLILNDK